MRLTNHKASGDGAIARRFHFAPLAYSVLEQRCRWLEATLVLWLLAPSLAAAVTFTNLHSFLVTTLGREPQAPVAIGSDGNLYGTTTAGGVNVGQGTVFKITTNGLATLLHTFTGAADGGASASALIQWTDGSFYGTTSGGGTYGSGTVFKITTGGVLTTLVQFTGGNDGGTPAGGLVMGPDGNFYGVTVNGGVWLLGTVFRMAPGGQLTTLLSFANTNGAFPNAPLTVGRDGKLYGTTTGGGVYNGDTLFQISTNGAFNRIRSFGSTESDPYIPYGPLVQGLDGNFYGTAYYGGANNLGCVFKINTSGAFTNLYSFGTVTNTNGNPLDGSNPYGGLVFGSDGNLYGTTETGGTNDPGSGGDGTIFRITSAGVLTTLTLSLMGSMGPHQMLDCCLSAEISMGQLSKVESLLVSRATAPYSRSG